MARSLRVAVLAATAAISPVCVAQPTSVPVTPSPVLSTAAESASILAQLQTRQGRLTQQTLSGVNSDAQLAALAEESQTLTDEVEHVLAASLEPADAKVHSQLEVLGPPPSTQAAGEAPTVAGQRRELAAQEAQLDAEIGQAVAIKESATNVRAAIARVLHEHLKDQLALRSGSILGAGFWAPLFRPESQDHQRLSAFGADLGQQLASAWQPGEKLKTALALMFSLTACTIGARQLERLLAFFCLQRLPEGRLRRSALAASVTLASMASAICAIQLVGFTLTRQQPLSPELQEFFDEIVKGTLTSALIAALGRALLCTRHPSWRLPRIADPVAHALSPFPRILAGLLMLAGALEQVNRTADTSLQLTLFGRGLVALVVAITVGIALLRANRVRSALATASDSGERRSGLADAIPALTSLAVTGSLLALLLGYIGVARYIAYELVWCQLVLCSVYILTKFTHDVCENLLSANGSSGKVAMELFGAQAIHLDIASSVLSGLGRSTLLIASLVALLTGGFGMTPAGLIINVLRVFGAERSEVLNVVPDHVLNALVTLGIGLCLVRSVRNWLDHDLLPKTGMASGMRASLLTLFVNFGHVMTALLTLSVLGVKWSSLAWIVSALSVGIGFGLQEIVKNFISGLILLTERPVKVGDMVSLGGVEGDIRRINVRATEIQLADRSTVIVPNSQLIAQNVRNVTMGNHTQGVAVLTLTFPLDIDPELVRDILVNTYRDNPSILDHPPPSVVFSQLSPGGITLNVTGFVSSPRIAADVKSELLFELLKQLRAAGIPLSSPQSITVLQGSPRAPRAGHRNHHDEYAARHNLVARAERSAVEVDLP